MLWVKSQGGHIGCPDDAVYEIKGISEYIAQHKGGEGAVRDFINYILELDGVNMLEIM